MKSELVEWIYTRQDWQQKILTDLLSNQEINDNYIKSIVAYMKTPAGQEVTSSKNLSQIDTDEQAQQGLSRLNYIENVKGVDLLKCDTKLEFKQDNLTVIYGDNGSGKTGYVRLLKKICIKPYEQKLKSNIHSKTIKKKECTVCYVQKGKATQTIIDLDNVIDTPLQDVKIFDTHMGSAYLNEEKSPSYIPRVLLIMQDFASAVDKVAEELKKEKTALCSRKPIMPAELNSTEHYRWYTGLNSDTTEEEITKHATWTESNASELKIINEGKSKADLQKDKRDKESKKSKLEEHIKKINQALESLNAKGLETLMKLHKAMIKSTKASVDGGKITDGAILYGVGEATWEALWEAARKYSVEKAYIGESYPNVGENARCVLCQQELNERAKQRLESFENHIKGELATNAKQATKAYKDAIALMPTYDNLEDITTIINAGGITDVQIIKKVNVFWTAVKNIKVKIDSADYKDMEALCETSYPVIQKLKTTSEYYYSDIERIVALLNADTSEIDARKKNLTSQKWLSEQQDQIKAEILLLKSISIINKLLVKTNTKSISDKTKVLVKKYITAEYIERFNRVLRSLSITDLKVALDEKRIDKATPWYHIFIKDANGQIVKVTNILSEGEKRILEIASFITDMERKPSNAPFIFDDPISSLDDCYQRKVVARLLQIAKERQVIVFTHRLALVNDLLGHKHVDEAIYMGRNCNVAGIVERKPFKYSKPALCLNRLINDHIPQAEKMEGTCSTDDMDDCKRLICQKIRLTIESIIEKVLFNGIVLRHSREIQTKGKIDRIHQINEDDCKRLDELMTKYSFEMHCQPDESPGCLPSMSDLKADVTELLSWHNEFINRNK
ncbi:MAG: hypothetical protein RBS43_04815 [Candidatus Cloacimonas sp.]|jgi:energy-coupling factor transporter ATP-binding protein EcfA2|nr:hypothetical protein [Candidatus Cloacimonas sp.]